MKDENQITKFFFRIFPATAGGFLGTGIFLLVFLLLQGPASENLENAAFSRFAVLVISFVGAVSANIFAMLFLALANSEIFTRKKVLLTNVMAVTILLFLASVPFFLISETTLEIAGMFLIFSAAFCAVFAEMYMTGSFIGGIYGAMLSSFILLVGFVKLFRTDDQSAIGILLFLLPVTWFLISMSMFVGEVIFQKISDRNV